MALKKRKKLPPRKPTPPDNDPNVAAFKAVEWLTRDRENDKSSADKSE